MSMEQLIAQYLESKMKNHTKIHWKKDDNEIGYIYTTTGNEKVNLINEDNEWET